MANERNWLLVEARPLTSNGGSDGSIVVASTSGFKVKQKIKITAIGEDPRVLEVKSVVSPTTLFAGPVSSNIKDRADLSTYTTANASTISAGEQSKKGPTDKDIHSAVYEQEPTVAYRTINVDELGKFYSLDNPFPVQLSDGSIEIGTVNAEVEVQLSHKDDTPDAGDIADSVRVGNGIYEMEVNPDGSINVKLGELPGTPIVYKETGAVTDITETKVAEYTSTVDGNKIKRMCGMAMTFGIWRIYKGSIAPANIVAITQTSPTARNADMILLASEVVDNTEKVLITFQAERYRSNLLGASSQTFVRLEGYNF